MRGWQVTNGLVHSLGNYSLVNEGVLRRVAFVTNVATLKKSAIYVEAGEIDLMVNVFAGVP
jgi:hypothetical protein